MSQFWYVTGQGNRMNALVVHAMGLLVHDQ